jgi:hypothetical protein
VRAESAPMSKEKKLRRIFEVVITVEIEGMAMMPTDQWQEFAAEQVQEALDEWSDDKRGPIRISDSWGAKAKDVTR